MQMTTRALTLITAIGVLSEELEKEIASWSEKKVDNVAELNPELIEEDG
jgi:hypothetical protein